MHQLKQKFIQTVQNTWGEKGVQWLAQLPNIITKLSVFWDLTDIQDVPNMSYNYVAYACQGKSRLVVLKVSCDQTIFEDECRALQYFDGCGSVKLLDKNEVYQSLLLQRINPGKTLKENRQLDINLVIENYAKVVNVIASAPVSNNEYFTHVQQWCADLERITDPRIEGMLIDKAKNISRFLLSTAQHEYVCHGDLHLENIIQHGSEWASIDPKGIVGEKAFEAAAFDLLAMIEFDHHNNITDILQERLLTLSAALAIPYERLLFWAFIRCMISAQWFIEDNGDPSMVLKLIHHIYPLIEGVRDDQF